MQNLKILKMHSVFVVNFKALPTMKNIQCCTTLLWKIFVASNNDAYVGLYGK